MCFPISCCSASISVGIAVFTTLYSAYAVTAGQRTMKQLALPLLVTIALAVSGYVMDNITDQRLTIFCVMILFVGALPAERHYRLPARYRTESPAAVDTPP